MKKGLLLLSLALLHSGAFAQTTVVGNGLTYKWGTSGAGNVLVTDGDSITYRNLYQPLLATTATFSVTNTGVSGTKVSDSAAAAWTAVDPLYSNAAQWNIDVIMSGTNDWFYSNTVAQAYQELRGYCDARRRVGWKVVVVTMLSRTGTGADTFKNSYNALIRAHWKEFSDALADVAMDPILGSDGAAANATWFPDGTHPASGARLAPIISAAINLITSGYTTAGVLALGPNLVTNGGFTSGASWTINPAGWTVSGNAANITGTNGALSQIYQNIGLTLGNWYAVTITVASVASVGATAGELSINVGGTSSGAAAATYLGMPGTHTIFLYADTGTNGILIVNNNPSGGNNPWSGSISNVSARLVLSAPLPTGNRCSDATGLAFLSASACY